MDENRRLRDLSFGSMGADASLIIGGGITPLGDPLSNWIASEFNHNMDAYDQAIDSVYNQTHWWIRASSFTGWPAYGLGGI